MPIFCLSYHRTRCQVLRNGCAGLGKEHMPPLLNLSMVRRHLEFGGLVRQALDRNGSDRFDAPRRRRLLHTFDPFRFPAGQACRTMPFDYLDYAQAMLCGVCLGRGAGQQFAGINPEALQEADSGCHRCRHDHGARPARMSLWKNGQSAALSLQPSHVVKIAPDILAVRFAGDATWLARMPQGALIGQGRLTTGSCLRAVGLDQPHSGYTRSNNPR